ncbi:MAG: DUF2505 domain-containing protein [Actinomycetales bacterium]|nr:DUF2505 domain-containing protein [Tetrasphaera sp.]NLW98863.1 DUF2505 domain-containing protein [Actinomycetales bacterium]
MKVTTHATYVLGPDEILEIIADEEFQEEKCRATYAVAYSVSVRERAGRLVVTTERSMPMEHLPEIARGFVGNRLVIHESQEWHGPNANGLYTADLKVHVAGAPITGTGRRVLAPTGSGSRDQIDFAIKAAIPLIGRKIEEAAGPPVGAAAEIETELLAARANGG